MEDDTSIAEPLVNGLEREGFVVERVATGAEALAAAPTDMVLLDLGLPDIDGYEVCRRLRADSDVPIIVVTARGDEIDRVIGLELGADDYLVKPFGLRELVARIRAVTRRSERRGPTAGRAARASGRSRSIVRTRRVTVDGDRGRADPQGVRPAGPPRRGAGATRTREEILEKVWDAHWYGPTKTLDVHIASLRRKLGRPDARSRRCAASASGPQNRPEAP